MVSYPLHRPTESRTKTFNTLKSYTLSGAITSTELTKSIFTHTVHGKLYKSSHAEHPLNECTLYLKNTQAKSF